MWIEVNLITSNQALIKERIEGSKAGPTLYCCMQPSNIEN